ncbi:MAG: prepilin peptidase [Hyphomicrobiales bacterium]|nr:prepilin peptidase [Hyphomicrobiales bacterium]
MLDLAVLVIFPGLMVFAAISDMLTMTIPNRVSLVLIAAFFLLAPFMGLSWSTVGWHVAAGLLVLVVTFMLFNFGWVGGGDAKLAAATALWLGFPTLPRYAVLAAIIGGVITLGLLQLRRFDLPESWQNKNWMLRLHDSKVGIPYGIALAIAGLIVYPDSAIWLAAKAI